MLWRLREVAGFIGVVEVAEAAGFVGVVFFRGFFFVGGVDAYGVSALAECYFFNTGIPLHPHGFSLSPLVLLGRLLRRHRPKNILFSERLRSLVSRTLAWARASTT